MRYITPIMGALLAVAITACAPANQAYTKPPAALSSDDQAQFAELMQRAEAGDVQAQFKLAKHYCDRDHRDGKQAEYWLSKAAEQGLEGKKILGNVYFNGSCGIKKDVNQARKLVYLMAEQGDTNIQASLGRAYVEGENGDLFNIKPDLKKAKKYLRMACDGGDQASCQRLNQISQ